jgi:hypothetical protein
MEPEDVESPQEGSKRDRESPISSAKRSKHNSISRTRSKHTTSIVSTTKGRERLLARNGMVELLTKKLFSPVRSPNDPRDFSPFSHSKKKVNDQMLQLRSMVPTASNILLTDVKIFYEVLPKDRHELPFKKMYRYVFFRFEDAIFSLKLTEQKGENYLYAAAALPFIFRDNEGQICTLGNLLQSNSSVESASFRLGPDDSYEKSKNCRVDGKNSMLRRYIRCPTKHGRPQEYDNLVLALQYANDSNELQMVVPNPESLGMLLLKLGVGTEAEADAIKQIFRNNENVRFPDMEPQETEAAIDKGTHLTKMLQKAVSSSRGGSRRSSKRRKSRTIKKRK